MTARRSIQGRVNPQQSILLDKFISIEDIRSGVFHEEFPIGIRRAYRLINPQQSENFEIYKKLEEANYKFGTYKSDIEMLNNLRNFQLDDSAINNAFGFLTPSNLQHIDAVFVNERKVWIIEIKPTKNSQDFRNKSKEALGQVLFYADLFKEDYSTTEIERKIIICGKKDKSELIDATCDKYRIEVICLI